MVHNYTTSSDLIEEDVDVESISISELGKCFLRIKAGEDDQLPPQGYLIRESDGTEICSINLLESKITPNNALNDNQKDELSSFVNTPIYYKLVNASQTPFDGMCDMWIAKNGPEDDHIKMPYGVKQKY